jgi:hypothetical protein
LRQNLILFLIAMIAPGVVHAADTLPTTEPTKNACVLEEVFQFDGWRIPGLAVARPDKREIIASSIPGVVATRMRVAKTDDQLVIIDCSRDSPGRIKYRRRLVSVMEMWRYECDGRVFAYSAVYSLATLEKGRRVALLGYVPAAFYDVDGSGRFQVMKYQESVTLLNHIEVPQWVRNPSKAAK